MSFYGNQYLEFQKFFYRLLCKSSGVKDTTFPKKGEYLTSTLEQSIEPQSTHDKFILDTANRWIRMVPHKAEDGSVDGIQFFHAEAAGADGKSISLDTFTLNEKSSDDETQLEFGDGVIAHTLEFDEAGHINKTASHNYKMPAVTIAVGKEGDKSNPKSGLFKFIPKDEWITLTSKDDSIIVGHKDAEDLEAGSVMGWENFGSNKPDGQINDIDTGSYFAVPQFTYDDRGHITKVESKYYKLPMVQVEAETQALREDVTDLQKTVSDHSTKINSYATKITQLENKDTQLDKNLQTLDTQLNDKIGVVDKLNTTLNDTSLTGVIGDIKAYSQIIGELNSAYENRELTVSEGMRALGSIIKNLSERIGTYDSAIIGLQAQIDALKG